MKKDEKKKKPRKDKQSPKEKPVIGVFTEERCIYCGDLIPEGIMICPACEAEIEKITEGKKPHLRKRRTRR